VSWPKRGCELLQPQPGHLAGVLRKSLPHGPMATVWNPGLWFVMPAIEICSGGHSWYGESTGSRAGLPVIHLANLPEHPKAVPINIAGQGQRARRWKTKPT